VLALMLECRIPGKSQFRTFFLSPMMVPVASVVLIWQVLFNYNGTVNEFIMLFGAERIDWLQSDNSMIVVLLLFLWKNLGYFMILFMAGLANIPKALLEVCDVEGASAAYKFFNIKLRYLSPTVLFVTILSLINSFKVFREVYLLTGDYPYESLYMLQHFMNNTFRSLDYQKLSAAAVVMALVMVVLIALLFWIEDAFGKDVEGASPFYKFFNIKLRYLSPTVLFVTILSLINSFKVFREVYLLTGDYPYESLYMLQHFMNNTFRSLDYQKLSAAAVVMALVMVVLIALLFWIEDKFGKDVEG
jgi:multiple sugar transport system permease protein